MGESMITSFDGTKLYLKKETAADNKALITEDMDVLKVKRLFIQISMSFWTTPT